MSCIKFLKENQLCRKIHLLSKKLVSVVVITSYICVLTYLHFIIIKMKLEEHIRKKVIVNLLVTNSRKKLLMGVHQFNPPWLNDPIG
jgi:hypothetical protein